MNTRLKGFFPFLLALLVVGLPDLALAGTGGTEFSAAYTSVTGWIGGELGRLITAGLLVVGLGMGIVKQSVMAAVPAIACGLIMSVSPAIIDSIVTAVI